MTVKTVSDMVTIVDILKKGLKTGPVVCGYWDPGVSGYHAVALHNLNKTEVWAMDPNGGSHVKRTTSYFLERCFAKNIVFGYKG